MECFKRFGCVVFEPQEVMRVHLFPSSPVPPPGSSHIHFQPPSSLISTSIHLFSSNLDIIVPSDGRGKKNISEDVIATKWVSFLPYASSPFTSERVAVQAEPVE